MDVIVWIKINRYQSDQDMYSDKSNKKHGANMPKRHWMKEKVVLLALFLKDCNSTWKICVAH